YSLFPGAAVADVVGRKLAASRQLGVAERGLQRAAHLARRERSELVERRFRRGSRELASPIVRVADVAVDGERDGARAALVGRVDLVDVEAIEQRLGNAP